MDVASAEAVAGLVRAVGRPCAVITARGPRAKPVAEKGAICSVVLKKIFFLLKYRWFTMLWQIQVYSKVIQLYMYTPLLHSLPLSVISCY